MTNEVWCGLWFLMTLWDHYIPSHVRGVCHHINHVNWLDTRQVLQPRPGEVRGVRLGHGDRSPHSLHTSSPSSHCHHTRPLTSPIIHLYLLGKRCPFPLMHYVYIDTRTTVSRGQRLATVMSWVGSGPGLGWGKQSIHYLVCHYCHSPRHNNKQPARGPLLLLLLTLLVKHFLFTVSTSAGSMVLLFVDLKRC